MEKKTLKTINILFAWRSKDGTPHCLQQTIFKDDLYHVECQENLQILHIWDNP